MIKQQPPVPRVGAFLLRISVLLLPALGFLPVTPILAQSCDRAGCSLARDASGAVCYSPASPAPSGLWDELQPTDTGILPSERDATGFDDGRELYWNRNWFKGVDVQNGWLIAGLGHGIGIWDARTNPANPTFVSAKRYAPAGSFPYIPSGEASKMVFGAVAAPPGVDTVAAVAGANGAGLLVFDLSDKVHPKPVYQSTSKSSQSVYAATIGGAHYAFMPASNPSGVFVYNLDRALTFNGCFESVATPSGASCSGVLVGSIPAAGTPYYVHGVDNYLAVSYGSSGGFQVFDVSNPANPQLRLSGLLGFFTGRSAQGIAMWKQGSQYYLAARLGAQPPLGPQLGIYDVSCIATSSCSALSAPLSLVSTDSQSVSDYLTFSRSSGAKPFLYASGDNSCGGADGLQREWLFDVSNPVAPRDVSVNALNPKTLPFNGNYNEVSLKKNVNYWTWYYRGSPTGFYLVTPQAGKFNDLNGDYFYRAALSIMDFHKLTTSSPPAASFTWSPAEIYPNDLVTFADTSTGAPTGWSWTFQPDGSGNPNIQNPVVSFPTPGTKTVTLTASNGLGPSVPTPPTTVTVLNPNPDGAVSASTATATQCQAVTFTANVTGRKPLAYNWQVLDANNLPVAGPSDGGSSYLWTSAAGTSPGTYKGQVTIKNTASPGGVVLSSPPVKLTALPPLADISGSAPTADFTSNPVQFTAPDVTGATTIVWDYGDGTPPVTFTDPVAGRTPTHTYAAPGTYNAKVTISNCVNTQGSTSKTVPVVITIQVTAEFHAILFCQAAGCFATTGVPVSFTDASVGATTWDYDWDHADPSQGTCNFTDTGNTTPVASHTYSSPGTYYPCLRVKLGTVQSPVAVHSPKIVVQTITQPPPPPTISVSGPATGQTNQAYTFSASASNCTPVATGWSWSVGGGTIAGSSTGSTISVSWSTEGRKNISAANSGCSGASGGTASINVSAVNGGVLQALFTFSPAAPKAGDRVSFDSAPSTNVPAGASIGWSFGDGGSASGATANHAFTSAAPYTVTLTITPAGCINPSCLAQSSQTVTVAPNGGPQFTVSPGTPSSGDAAIFDASASTNIPAGSQFGWSFGDGSASGFGTVISHTFATPGTFNVVLAVAPPGCSAANCLLLASKTITVVPGNGVHFTVSPESPSATQAATFDASSSTNVAAGALIGWDFGDGSGPSFGKIVTHAYAQQGSYNVVLSIAPPGCGSVSCLALAGKTITVGPPPPVSADFSANVTCGTDQCQAQTAKAVTLTASAADGTTYTWSFGDNTTGNTRQVTHTWGQPGTYTVTLTVTKGLAFATKSLSFVVTGPPPPKTKTTLLPLATQSRGVLVQSNDLYVYNPGSTPLEVTLEFRKRGTPDVNPPRSVSTLQPGATLFAPDMLSSLFNVENVAGFITVVTSIDSVEPVITSFNSQGATASKLFGLTIPGSSVGSPGSATTSGPVSSSQFLVGLHDSPERQSSFGFSNPTDDTATYHLQFYDKTGRLLSESQDLTLSGHDQRQFSLQEIRDTFGINNLDDYRVEVTNVSGAQVFPFGSDIRVVTGDPSFTEPGNYASSRLYLLGVFTGAGAAKSTWQTDLLLSNVGDQPLQTTLTFTAVSNKASVKAAQVTVQPLSTERLENALFSQFGLRNATGVLTLTSTSPNGIFPIARAESYDNTNPAKRYGQSLIALSDADAADTTKKEVLVGLRQDGANKTTLWILNPSGTAGTYDVVYRGLNGAVLGTLPGIKIGAGQLRQISPSQHPLKKGGVPGGFTVEVVVKSGKALAAAQVVRAGTNDPVFVAAEVR